MKLFHRTQRDLATAINQTIDEYWNDNITEYQMITTIRELHENNTNKFVNKEGFTTIIQQKCGKRRLEVVEKVLNIE